MVNVYRFDQSMPVAEFNNDCYLEFGENVEDNSSRVIYVFKKEESIPDFLVGIFPLNLFYAYDTNELKSTAKK